jgi:hypothetical protein
MEDKREVNPGIVEMKDVERGLGPEWEREEDE